MTSPSPIENWHFLVGKWKGHSPGDFGGEGEIVTTDTISLEMDGKFIMFKNEVRREGKLEHKSIGLLFCDVRNKKFLQKTFFSYGFVNNEVEYSSSETEIRFDVVSEPTPQAFDGTRWRSYIIRVSDDEIRTGLEMAKEGEDFVSYGETILKRVK